MQKQGGYTGIIQRKDKAQDKYNVLFTLEELKAALAKCMKSAPGKYAISS